MRESIEKLIEERITAVKASTEDADIIKNVCPFFEKGLCPDCFSCKKDSTSLEECRDYYLERIRLAPMEIWDESFDRFIVQSRTPVNVEEIVGIGISCDSCYMNDKCPLYKKGYACGIKWDNNRPETPMEFMDFLVNTQYERVKRYLVFEKTDGGVPAAGVSGEMDRLHELVASKINMSRERLSINVEATGAATSGGGGILAKLFGSGNKPAIETPAKVIPEKSETIKGDVVDITEFQEVKEAEKVPRKRKNK